jgi:thiosulfate/3-mercaptopyruvate sulfurtransferase
MRTLSPLLALTGLLLGSTAQAGISQGDVIISAKDAHDLMGKPNVVFVFAGSDAAYKKGHIPGSVHAYSHDMQYLDDVQKCGGLPMCEANAEAFVGGLGISNDTTVIAYEDGKGVNESGIWFFLKTYGHDNVKIMEGGLPDWQAAGWPVEAGEGSKPAKATFDAKPNTSMIATLDDVKNAKAKGALVLDARHKLEEFTGQDLKDGMKNASEHIKVARGGHVPDAVFSPWSKYAGNKGGEAGKPVFKSADSLKGSLERLAAKGYAPDKEVITYCHVGLGRGSFQYLALQLAGHDKSKLYMGSWSEYGNSDLPVETQ